MNVAYEYILKTAHEIYSKYNLSCDEAFKKFINEHRHLCDTKIVKNMFISAYDTIIKNNKKNEINSS